MKQSKIDFYKKQAEQANEKYCSIAPLNKKQIARYITANHGGDEAKHYENLLRFKIE